MKEAKEKITENGIEYILVGDYYFPDLKLPDERFELIIEQMKHAEGVTEKLKSRNLLEWTRQMNNIYNRAGEIIKSEMIYI